MNEHTEFELTDKQLEDISGGSWGSGWGNPWSWSPNWSSGGFWGGQGFPIYPSNQTTHQNTVAQVASIDAPQNVSYYGSDGGGTVIGPSATQAQVSTIA